MALPISKEYLLTQLRNFKSAILDPAYTIQKSALPTASSANEGAIFQYIGSDSTNYTIGGFYQCQEVTPATDPKTYHWVEVSGGPDDNFVGTLAQWNALPLAEQIKYKTADITDDFNGSPIDSALSDTSTNPVQNKVITEELNRIRDKVLLGRLGAIDAQVAMGNYQHYYLLFNINDYYYSQLYEIDTKQRHQIIFGAGAWIAAYQISKQTGNYLQWMSETDIAGTKPSAWTITIDVYAN